MRLTPDDIRNGYGLAENLLTMATEGIAEPVSGLAALVAAAQGYDAGGARDAIRGAMTFQPKSAQGVLQQRALARLAQGVVDSAPVRTWQRGVDIAGRYSPAAGAALQTIPTAIGAAYGAKPAMQQGRAASYLAERMQEKIMKNAMAPRTLHPQAGSINFGGKVYEPGARIHAQQDLYEYLGDTEKPYLVKVKDIRTGNEAIISKRAITAMSDKPQPKEVIDIRQTDYDKSGFLPERDLDDAPKKGNVRLYHGSYYEWPENAQIGSGSRDRFGGVFTAYGGVEPAYSGVDYYIDIPESKILTRQTLGFDVPAEKKFKALENVTGVKRRDPRFQAYVDAIIDEQDQRSWIDDSGNVVPGSFQDVHRIKGLFSGADDADYGWEAQRLRGQFAKELGYDAVEMTDETGTSVLVVKKDKMSRLK